LLVRADKEKRSVAAGNAKALLSDFVYKKFQKLSHRNGNMLIKLAIGQDIIWWYRFS